MAALALALSWLEAQIPPFFALPGMKLGLTNLVVLLTLYRMGSPAAMAINLVRILLSSLLFGGFMALMYSLAGGMLSTTVMILLKRFGKFRPLTVSIAGGISHNIGQIAVAMIVMNTAAIGWYLCVLWLSGLVTGALIGLLGGQLIRKLPERLFPDHPPE